MDIYFIPEEQYYLQKLNKYLNYELSTAVLYFLSYAGGITLTLAIIAAVIFIPFILYIFIKARKVSWLISFCVLVIIPVVGCIIIGLKFNHFLIFILIHLGFFYFYCFIMKLVINENIKEIIAREELRKERNEKQEKMKLWQSQFNVDK